MLSDTSARTYVFDEDITANSQRFGAGANIPCGIYSTQPSAFRVNDDLHSQTDNFTTLCDVPFGADHRVACQGRVCPSCVLMAPPECFVRNAEQLHYVNDAIIEAPVALSSARIPWDFHHDDGPYDFAMTTDAMGTQWERPIRSIRSYDTGACRLHVSWPRFASIVNEAFLGLFVSNLRTTSGIEAVFNAKIVGSAGPQLRGDALASRDEVFLRTDAYAYIQAGIPWSVERHVSGLAFTRFSVSTTANAAGYQRVVVPYVTSWTDHLPTTPWEVGEALARVIPKPDVFPAALSAALRDAMLIPAFTSTGALIGCDEASTPLEGSSPAQAGVAQCEARFDVMDATAPGQQSHFAGPERGCYSRSAFQSLWNSLLPAGSTGICATRLQPRHVNVLPEGLQIVLVDQGLQEASPDPMARLVEFLPGAINSLVPTGLSVECAPAIPPAVARLHLVEPRTVSAEPGATASCGLPGTPGCGSL